MSTTLNAQVDRSEDGVVFLTLPDGQTLRIPESAFHGTPIAGTEVRLLAVAASLDQDQDQAFAQRILNALLGTHS